MPECVCHTFRDDCACHVHAQRAVTRMPLGLLPCLAYCLRLLFVRRSRGTKHSCAGARFGFVLSVGAKPVRFTGLFVKAHFSMASPSLLLLFVTMITLSRALT